MTDSVERLEKALVEFYDMVPEEAARAAALVVGELGAERKRREEAEQELARIQALPEMDWARVTSTIAQTLGRLARTEQPAARKMMEALDAGKVYVDRLRGRAEQAERERDEALRDADIAQGARQAAVGEADSLRAEVARLLRQGMADASTPQHDDVCGCESDSCMAGRMPPATDSSAEVERLRDERNRSAGEALNLDIAWAAMKERAERAEADNAALLDIIRRFRTKPPEEHPGSAVSFMRWHMDNERAADEALREAHPGAAMLERMRALEAIVAGVRRSPLDEEDSDYARGYGDGWSKRGAVMRSEVDALKPETK